MNDRCNMIQSCQACQIYIYIDLNLEKLRCSVKVSFLNNQPDALIIQIYSVIKLYMFRASSLTIISSFLLYFRLW